MMILQEFGFEIGPIIAGAGIAGLAVGFGAQSLIKDLINGVFILFEQWYQVGDVITISGTTGTVERFNLSKAAILISVELKSGQISNMRS